MAASSFFFPAAARLPVFSYFVTGFPKEQEKTFDKKGQIKKKLRKERGAQAGNGEMEG